MAKFKAVIVKVMDCSTVHISRADAARLDDDVNMPNAQPLIVYDYDEGYFVYVGERSDDKQILEAGYSKDLVGLLHRARKAGCKYLQLDCDGPKYKGLKKYVW